MERAHATPSRGRLIAAGLAALAVVIAAAFGPGATSPRAGAVAEVPVRFAVVGDFGVDTAAEGQVATLVAGWSPDFVVSTGDNYYTTGTETGTARYDRVVGKYYCGFLAAAAAGTGCPSGGTSATNRFFPVTGNHDYSDGGIDNYTAYFTLPGAGATSQSPTGSELVYDVRRGAVHLFFLDSQAALDSGASLASQQAWLQSALAASDAPWKVVVFHHPPYSSGSHGSSAFMQWPFASWGVDLVLNGHDHTYERIETGGVTYVVDGLGGASRYPFSATPVAGSTVRYNANWGAMRISADSTALTSELVAVDGTVADRFVLDASPTTTVRLQDGVSPTGYAGTRDTTLSQAAPTTAMGSATTLLVDGDDPPGSGSDLAFLLRFDVSSIPTDAVVTSASIGLDAVNSSVNSYQAFEVLRSWDEGSATWTNASAGTPWGAPGASAGSDRGAALGTLSAPALGPVTLAFDATGLATLQGWIDGTRTNRGLVVAGTTPTDGIDVTSREGTTAAARPVLTVTYRLGTAPPTTTTTAPPTTTTTAPPTTTTTAPPTTTTTAAPAYPGAFSKSSPANSASGVATTTALRWAAASGATSYEYCLDPDRDSTCHSGWKSLGSATSVTRTLARNRSYSWQVRARNAAGFTWANGGVWWRFTTTK